MDIPKVGGQLMIYNVPYPFKIARYQLICLSFSNDDELSSQLLAY